MASICFGDFLSFWPHNSPFIAPLILLFARKWGPCQVLVRLRIPRLPCMAFHTSEQVWEKVEEKQLQSTASTFLLCVISHELCRGIIKSTLWNESIFSEWGRDHMKNNHIIYICLEIHFSFTWTKPSNYQGKEITNSLKELSLMMNTALCKWPLDAGLLDEHITCDTPRNKDCCCLWFTEKKKEA